MEIKLNSINYKDLLKDINITFNSGEITGVLGKNGSGKTTLLNLIYGFDNSFDGKISIDDITFDKNTSKKGLKLAKDKISYVRQEYIFDLFGRNLYYDIKKINLLPEDDKITEKLKFFGLNATFLRKSYSNFKKSEIKKALLMKALLSNKSIILLDDPTDGLDNKSKENLIKLLKKEKRNKIIIVSSMDSDFILKVSDKIAVIDDGKIGKFSDKYEMFSKSSLLKRINVEVPPVLKFLNLALTKNIKLANTDNTNDLIKEIYRNAKE